ncbi:hypothetical protein E8E11_006342 [Didymella keratinophila]|nr:hypothetical protein E8E11_006342 [Didymella keratinophila]
MPAQIMSKHRSSHPLNSTYSPVHVRSRATLPMNSSTSLPRSTQELLPLPLTIPLLRLLNEHRPLILAPQLQTPYHRPQHAGINIQRRLAKPILCTVRQRDERTAPNSVRARLGTQDVGAFGRRGEKPVPARVCGKRASDDNAVVRDLDPVAQTAVVECDRFDLSHASRASGARGGKHFAVSGG